MSDRVAVLVHGWNDDHRKMLALARALRRGRWTVRAPVLRPSDGSAGIETLAGQLAASLDAPGLHGARLAVIGFSMGGIVAQYYLQCLGGVRRTHAFVTIASPHRGTWIGYLSRSPGARQLRPGSALLEGLADGSSVLLRIPRLSLYTPLDLMIVSATSSAVPWMPSERHWVVAHPLMVFDRGVHRRILSFLSEAVPA